MKPDRKLIARMLKLQAVTTERGATEHEALAAAETLGRMMAEHNISLGELSDAEIRTSEFVDGVVVDESGRKTLHPAIKFTAVAVARYTDTIAVKRGKIGVLFFGHEQDVQVAMYLCNLFRNVCESEYKSWRKYGDGRFYASGEHMKPSFISGFTRRISGRLNAMKAARDSEVKLATGRDLMVIKTVGALDAFQARFGWRPRGGTRGHYHSVNRIAFGAGQSAGDRVTITTGIGGSFGHRQIGH